MTVESSSRDAVDLTFTDSISKTGFILGLALQEDEILVPAPGTNMKEGLGHNLHLILSSWSLETLNLQTGNSQTGKIL